MSLYNKYRPTTFAEMIGNEETITTLQALLIQERKPQAYLLHGPTGCGKTTLGRILAIKLGAVGNDYREVDSADFRGIDTIREMRKQSHFRPLEGPCRVWLLDECHKLSNDAMNALLKALERPSSHVYYILCTTDPQKLLPTIRGRCSQFQVSPLSERYIIKLVRHTARAEGKGLVREVYEQIAQDSLGLPRNALQILEQVLAVPPEKRLEVAKKSAELQSQTIELCRALMENTGWKKVAHILNGLKDQEPETIRRQVLGYCQVVLLKGDSERAGLIMEEFIEPFYNSGCPGLTLACYRVIKT